MYKAKDVMNTNVITVGMDTTVEDAICTLVQNRISGAPVVDDQGRLVGVISEFQLLETVYSPQVKGDHLRDFMTRDVLTVDEDTLLSDIANMMVLHRVRRLPVVHNGKVIGIVARRDMLRYLMENGEKITDFLNEVRTFAEVP